MISRNRESLADILYNLHKKVAENFVGDGSSPILC